MKYKGTVVPGLVTRPTFWISFCLYWSVNVCSQNFHDQCGQYLPVMTTAQINFPSGGMLVFFLAFYCKDCYARFFLLYVNVKNIEGCIRSILVLMRYYYQRAQ